MFIVATNVIASRPPERLPTGTPHARAKIGCNSGCMSVEEKQKYQPSHAGALAGRLQ